MNTTFSIGKYVEKVVNLLPTTLKIKNLQVVNEILNLLHVLNVWKKGI